MTTALIGATGRVGSEIVRAVLDDPPGDLLGVTARRGARGTRVAHLDRSGRPRPHGLDRPSRRRRGRVRVLGDPALWGAP